MQKKQFSPEANATSGGGASKKTAISNIPKADANFTAALKNTTDTTKNLSNKVAARGTDRQKIHSVLIAIRHLIYANYPDTCDQVLREWGFIKQNF